MHTPDLALAFLAIAFAFLALLAIALLAIALAFLAIALPFLAIALALAIAIALSIALAIALATTIALAFLALAVDYLHCSIGSVASPWYICLVVLPFFLSFPPLSAHPMQFSFRCPP